MVWFTLNYIDKGSNLEVEELKREVGSYFSKNHDCLELLKVSPSLMGHEMDSETLRKIVC